WLWRQHLRTGPVAAVKPWLWLHSRTVRALAFRPGGTPAGSLGMAAGRPGGEYCRHVRTRPEGPVISQCGVLRAGTSSATLALRSMEDVGGWPRAGHRR